MVGVADERSHAVPAEARGERLDAYLARVFPDLSRSRIQALLETGDVQVDGRVRKASHRLSGGESLLVRVPPPVPAEALPEDLPLTLLYEDADLVVLDKAAGMVVHPGAGHDRGTLVNALLHRVADLRGVGGELRPGIVHRLDKDTSGCIVVAKHAQALAALQAAFKSRDVDKTYLALVHGKPPAEGRIDTHFGRHPVHRQRFTGRLKEGKRAVTVFHTREHFQGAALVEVELHTGRTHQIRVHLSEAGHPLLCDELYGGARKVKGPVAQAQEVLGRQALHAWKLEFPHPRTGQRLHFEAPLPADFKSALEALRAATPSPSGTGKG
ncbi:MAG: RluA family pseudouridine synthase [Myxococcaceae bacterium]|nr:RluA family pseudouridine synthase [Myxococcaceae bacterium]MCI0670024.1 RluA family pseudouridine synthase [Myxococcaceae bacterium]